ncbi:hypothetical protein ASC96_26575 [Rhizobium sp. Root1204]|nr:hypothetical protein ASC96_26575 [Rhizobium sp. Root1204]
MEENASTLQVPQVLAPPRHGRMKIAMLAEVMKSPLGRSACGLLLLLVVGAILEPRTVSPDVILSMLPFAAILGVAAIGQHLVVQQRGFDLSVTGTISMTAVLVTSIPSSSNGNLGLAFGVFVGLAFGMAAGLVNGVIVNRLRVTPLVTTLGMNAVLLGFTYWYANGVPVSASPALSVFANQRTLGVPNVMLIAAVLFAVAVFILDRTRIGRSFIAVGVNPTAARALAIPVDRYQIMTYAVAGFFFSAAAILLAGFMRTPTLLSGSPYMLTTVAAIVVGGNPLNGDRASLTATLIGAAFLTYLDQLVLSLGFAQSMQNITQAAIIVIGVALPAMLRGLKR